MVEEERLREFVLLETEKKRINDRLAEIRKRLDELESWLVPQFLTANTQSINIDGRTVYLQQEVYVSPLDGERKSVAAALKLTDAAAYVEDNYNTLSLKKWVKEIRDEARERCIAENRLFDEEAMRLALPEPLQNVLKVSFVHELRSKESRKG